MYITEGGADLSAHVPVEGVNCVGPRLKIAGILSREEIRMLTQRSDWRGAVTVGSVWGAILLTFVFLAWASSWPLWAAIPAFLIGMMVLGGRQLALLIIMHDAAHGTLFRTHWLNFRLVDWICARPLWSHLGKYRTYHLEHHAHTGTERDPDLILSDGLPTTRASLMRKFLRDLTGVTGIKSLVGRALMDAGKLKWAVNGEVVWLEVGHRTKLEWIKHFLAGAWPMLFTNTLLCGILLITGYGWIYACWVMAYLTFFMVFVRVRSMAEHAATERSADMLRNTRTMRAGWLARSLVAPINVNFHREHHLLASCPHYRLAQLHQRLREKGIVGDSPGYWDVLKLMASGGEPQSQAPAA